MKLSRVLIVTKRSAFETHLDDERLGSAALSKARAVKVKALHASHDEHYRTLAAVQKVLARMNVAVDLIQRGEPFDDNGYDLVLSVGGDGTFISASHYLHKVPLLGVNSSPRGSVGFFCSATRQTIARDLAKIRRDALPGLSLCRLQIDVGGKAMPAPALNDVLYSHEQPAAMARYELRISGVREEQKSSGIWVAAPAGSGAAIGSAGGRKLPLTSRKFQYVVRELYRHERRPYRLRKGILGPDEILQIENHIGQAKIFIDGPHVSRTVPFGAVVGIRLSPYPLRVMGLRAPLKKPLRKETSRAKKKPTRR